VQWPGIFKYLRHRVSPAGVHDGQQLAGTVQAEGRDELLESPPGRGDRGIVEHVGEGHGLPGSMASGSCGPLAGGVEHDGRPANLLVGGRNGSLVRGPLWFVVGVSDRPVAGVAPSSG